MSVFKKFRLPVMWSVVLLAPLISLAASLENPVPGWTAPPSDLQSMRPVEWLQRVNIEHSLIKNHHKSRPCKTVRYMVSDSPKAWLVYREQQGLIDNDVMTDDNSGFTSELDGYTDALINAPVKYSLPTGTIIHWNYTDSTASSGSDGNYDISDSATLTVDPTAEDDEIKKKILSEEDDDDTEQKSVWKKVRHTKSYASVPINVKATKSTVETKEQRDLHGEIETFRWQIRDAQQYINSKEGTLYSLPFYTVEGYKLCLALEWITDEENGKKYLNIHLVPLEGESDGVLAWPVSAKIFVSFHDSEYYELLDDGYDYLWKFFYVKKEDERWKQPVSDHTPSCATQKLLSYNQALLAAKDGNLYLKANIVMFYDKVTEEDNCILL